VPSVKSVSLWPFFPSKAAPGPTNTR
jgi:hypothetical protein